jgi:hypothetical protein
MAARHVASGIVLVGLLGAAATAQEKKRTRSTTSIPVKKEIPVKAPAAPPQQVLLPGKKIEVVETPIVTRIERVESGPPIVLAAAAPEVGAAVPWIPLLGLLGGAALVSSRSNRGGAADVPLPPPPPPPPPPMAIPEPATMTLLASGLAGIAVAARRRRSGKPRE